MGAIGTLREPAFGLDRWVSPGGRALLFAVMGGVGLYFVLLYAGLVPLRAGAAGCAAGLCRPAHWQILSVGVALLAAGFAVVLPRGWTAAGRLCSLGLVLGVCSGVLGTLYTP